MIGFEISGNSITTIDRKNVTDQVNSNTWWQTKRGEEGEKEGQEGP